MLSDQNKATEIEPLKIVSKVAHIILSQINRHSGGHTVWSYRVKIKIVVLATKNLIHSELK